MWASPINASRLLDLRQVALRAMAGRTPTLSPVSLTLVIRFDPSRRTKLGGLYAFVAGVCCGLRAAGPGSNLSLPIWQPWIGTPIYPTQPIVFYDDDQVDDVVVSKVPAYAGNDSYVVTATF